MACGQSDPTPDSDARRVAALPARVETPLTSTAGNDVFIADRKGVWIYRAGASEVEQVLDASYRICPRLPANAADDDGTLTKVKLVGDRVYLTGYRCGLWTISLRDPAKKTPLLTIGDETSYEQHPSEWGNGKKLVVTSDITYGLSVSASSMLVCLSARDETTESKTSLQIWSVSPESGAPLQLLTKGARGCDDMVHDEESAFYNSNDRLFRWERATDTHHLVVGDHSTDEIQLVGGDAFFVEGGSVDDVPHLERIDHATHLIRTEYHASSTPYSFDGFRYHVDDRYLYIFLNSGKITRRPLDGSVADAPAFDLAPGETLAAPTSAEDRVWFVLTEQGKSYLAYASR